MLRGAGWPRPDISSESAMPAYRPCRKTTVRLRVPVGDFLPVVRHDLVRQSWREAVVRAAGWHRTVDAAEIELFASPIRSAQSVVVADYCMGAAGLLSSLLGKTLVNK